MPNTARWGLAAIAAAFCATPLMRPEYSLALGIVIALIGLAPTGELIKKLSRVLIQICVVLLGAGMNLQELWTAGITGLGFAFGTIVATFALGTVLALWMRVDQKLATLISSGTAICGGSAIAAVGSTIRASSTHMSVAIGVVFILNAVGLWIFPPIGHWLGLTQHQFGVWSAVAIHDVSSVVGASSKYGDEALHVATAVKLSRTLWIVPVALVAAWFFRSASGAPNDKAKLPVPWFIVLFVLASVVGTYLKPIHDWTPQITAVSRHGMCVALFLVGLGLNRKALASVGVRPLLVAVILWVYISVLALAAVRWTIA
ncbi:MAG: putative sulfate exporter family transporter [Phycisphaerales bacterium]|nr:putative sulfate exporter family transporter [Planctomycetota bacterium]